MAFQEIGERAFEQRNGSSILTCSFDPMMANNVVEMSVCSESRFMSSSGIDPFYSCGWNTVLSENQPQIQYAHPHHPIVLENQTMGNSSDLVQFTSDSGLVTDMVPNIPCLGSGSFSEMVTSFGHIDESGYNSSFPQDQGFGIQRASVDNADSPEQCLNSEHGVLGALTNAKTKRKNVEEEERTHQTEHGSEFPKATEERERGANLCSKQTVEIQAKGSSDILVRAKRGQATSSHSLAERVRRERISERMRLLQELVPGCDKITGKAVMLDETINYVQSLQQQVEFLSMKLATVNPPLPQSLCNNELQSILLTGFNSDPSISSNLREHGELFLGSTYKLNY